MLLWTLRIWEVLRNQKKNNDNLVIIIGCLMASGSSGVNLPVRPLAHEPVRL